MTLIWCWAVTMCYQPRIGGFLYPPRCSNVLETKYVKEIKQIFNSVLPENFHVFHCANSNIEGGNKGCWEWVSFLYILFNFWKGIFFHWSFLSVITSFLWVTVLWFLSVTRTASISQKESTISNYVRSLVMFQFITGATTGLQFSPNLQPATPT